MNNENPYSTSVVVDAHEETATERQSRLRKIAVAQRHVNLAVFFYFLLIIAIIVLPAVTQNAPWIGTIVAISGGCLMIYGALSVYRLAAILRGTFRAMLCVFGFLIPILGLLLLLSVNREATNILQRYRVKVRLLGANPNTI